MIASAAKVRAHKSESDWHDEFTNRIMPAVQRHARVVFRDCSADEKEENTQAAVCMALKAYRELIEQDKRDKIYPSRLADFACRQVRDGRQLGGHINTRDALSPRAQREKGFTVTGFSDVYDLPAELHEALGDHDRSPVPDQVAFRLDFPRWISTLPRRARKVARKLMLGHGTGKVAKMAGISPARVSQLRRELMESWHQFHNEALPAA